MIILAILVFLIIILFVIAQSSVYVFGSYINVLSIFSLWWYFLLAIVFINPESYFSISLLSSIIFISTPVIILLGSIFLSIFLDIRLIKNIALTPKYARFLQVDKILSVFMWILTSSIVYTMYAISQELDLDLQSMRDLMYSNDAGSVNALFEKLTAIKWASKGIFLYLIFKQLYIVIYLNNFRKVYYLALNTIFYLALNKVRPNFRTAT
jgi:hypothetical protein